MRPDDERYFERLEAGLDEALDVARNARSRGGDPTSDVEIPIAKDMADRVENILGIDGVAERVREMEADPDLSREEAALELAADFADGTVGEYDTRAGKVEGAVRTAVALLTEGVVAAPIEGIDRVEIIENDDGTEFINIYYAGPIRSAGGTAQALSVLVADYTRTLVGIEEYSPRNDEIERYAEELSLYDKETGLQYAPKDAEAKFIARNLPIMLDGEATGDEEVSGFRDLERVDTNNARGGMCLVLGEGLAQKAPKIQRYTSQLEEVEWPWLQDLIDGTYGKPDDADGSDPSSGADAEDGAEDDEAGTDPEDGPDGSGETAGDSDRESRRGPPRPEPNRKFLRDLIAGRPVFGHPSEEGGFRLRYGRARNHGFATAGVHPATMHLLDDFLATGTQIKTERPGKAAGVIPVDTIEGPTVKLANGDVRRIDDPEEALTVRNGVEEILDAGEYLVNYGEFVENNHPLAPASYTVEWWHEDLAAAGADVQALADAPRIDLDRPSAERALSWSETYDAPLHPEYTYLWHDLDVDRFEALAEAVSGGDWAEADGAAVAPSETGEGRTLVVPNTDPVREALEVLLVEHSQGEETLTVRDAIPLVRSLGLTDDLERTWERLSTDAKRYDGGESAIEAVNEVAPFEVRERAPTRIGCRMGRPEKSEKRDLSPAVHTLFPIGEAGGSQRDIAKAAKHADSMQDTPGEIEAQVGRRRCPSCETATFRARCPECNDVTDPHYVCYNCEIDVEPDASGRAICPRCESEADAVQRTTIDVNEEYRSALENVSERENAFDVLKGVQGLSSKHKVPEPIEKGILRAKNGVSSFKDGTVRYDMTDLPVTSVRAAELDVTVDQLRSLGYEEDIHGEPLTHEDQLVELRVQDVVLSDGAAEHMMRTAAFVDDLLEQYYGMDRYYELETREDLIGELVFGMAPHTSAAVVGRVIGFTSAAVGYAHPYFHAAKRRNCFHPETKLWYEDEDGWHHEEIEGFVESRLNDPETDDFGTLVQEVGEDEQIHVPSITGDGEVAYKPVEAVSKHPSPDHMVRIETRSGREITVTPDHEMQVYDSVSGSFIGKRAAEISQEDSLITPRHLDVISAEASTFDLLAEFLDCDSVPTDRLMVEGLSKGEIYRIFENVLAEGWNGQFYPLKSTAEYLGVSKKTLSNYVYRERFPITLLLNLFGGRDGLLQTLPDDVSLGLSRDSTSITRTIELNQDVATLLGYYAAEGFTRKQTNKKGTIHQTTLCGTETEAREFYFESLEAEFGVKPYVENDAKITVSGRLLRVFFTEVLDLGSGVSNKRIPDCVLKSEPKILSAYLGGYFSGDGSVEQGRLVVNATTVSKHLKQDLLAALTRLGIKTRVDTRDPTRLRDSFPEYYDIDDDSESAVHYVFTISSEDAVMFHETVGFHLTRKQRELSAQVKEIESRSRRVFDGGSDDALIEDIKTVEYTQSDGEFVYCLTVADTHSLITNDLASKQCDGDEDCVMLLMDGLINFSKTFLPDQRGGSVTEDSRLVAVGPDDEIEFLTFDEFWNELETPVHHDGKFEKKLIEDSGWRTYVFDEKHRSGVKPIERAIRYEADDEGTVLQISTQFGRSLEITEHHSLFRYENGIEEVAGGELGTGDLILAPREFDVEEVERTIDVVNCLDEPYVIIDEHIEDLLRTAWESTDRGSPTHEAFYNGLSHRLSRDKIPFERLSRILNEGGFIVPEDIEIALWGATDGIQRKISIDEEFAWLLGMFVAEGSLSGVNPTLFDSDEQIIDRVVSATEASLGIEPTVKWSNKSYRVTFPSVFREVLYELGFEDRDSYSSSEKVIPDAILRAPKETALAFIRGFVSGDGSKLSDDNYTSIQFHTTSDQVKDGFVFLLHRFGLVANVSRRERDESGQPIFKISVSGGASDNPLRRILEGDDPYHPKSLVVGIPDALMEIREMEIRGIKQLIPKYLERRENVSLEKLDEMVSEIDGLDLPPQAERKLDEIRPLVDGDLSYLRITDVEAVEYDGMLYDLQVGGEPIFTANWLYAHNSMDAPLVMSSRIDPSEIDDEAHNMDIVRSYPREFYEATREMADPGEVEGLIQLGEDTLGTDGEYRGFDHTHDTVDIAAGPDLSAYKTLGDMMEKMNAQLELARKLRAVDETDVAERVIEYHFLPDIIGNLRAFSRQETRCLDCGEKFRRVPLTGDCRECGGRVNLTVHEGSVKKYIDTAVQVASEYGCREYTKQRLEILDRAVESVFEDDTNRPSTLEEYM